MKAGIIGTGLMGSALAKCLSSKGIDLLVYNRTRSKAEKLCEDIKCKVVDSPKDMSVADYIVIFVFDDEALDNVVFGDNGLAYMDNKEVYILNSSTVSPRISAVINKKLSSLGFKHYYEAPVYGSVDEASSCSLVSMLAGSSKNLDDVVEFAKNYSVETIYVGEIPKAMALKLSLNNIGLSLPPIIAESLAILESYNVDLEKFLHISEKLWFGRLVKRYIERIRNTGKIRFTVKGAAKDYRLISTTLSINEYPSILSSALKNFYTSAISKYGGVDYPKAANWILKKPLG
ncbi:NAD(P)-dependent oxidoreductase [Staphylothermus hellenicus]|uniref:6-phosphogluconate dehydrogenase NAD-binding protein n=1 Tax=Staphylothermus hellenicus (strain DSM 12710 / JCM 10830 / BK20S6-10-b1 / P8) TaxID=591019 RepID=D7DC04_STAHD|nr:NAD(P)-dependent oxidoreductase [Staphylothermus hellenicus]ADI31701.1 6-phosphogluconate dehydrogenase NAD-binding protein [Staphylothermus hellenicus DSM 12710]